MAMIDRPAAAKLTFCLAATMILASAATGAPPSLPDLRIPPTSAPSLAQAQAMIADAERAADAGARKRGLAVARGQLEAFIGKPTSPDDLPTAQLLLGRVLILESRDVIVQAEQTAEEADRENIMGQARERLQRAELAFSAALEQLIGMGRGFPKFLAADDPNRPIAERIKELTLQSLMAHAGAAEELATTFPADSEQAVEYFKAAAERYERIYKDYRTLIVGLLARLKQGECCFRTGDTRRALGLYDDILNQPADLEPLRRLRVTAMYLSMECWTTEREKLYELAFSQGEEYLTHLRPEEESWPEWQAVRYHTARGYQLAAAGLAADRAADRAEFLNKAKNHAEKLATIAGPYQELARAIVGPQP
jgi:hypothetical protein